MSKTLWRFYGTLGCHLCDEVEILLNQAQLVAEFSYQKIDIMDLPESEMAVLADKIPVLVTPSRTLHYPFTIMDIMTLVE